MKIRFLPLLIVSFLACSNTSPLSGEIDVRTSEGEKSEYTAPVRIKAYKEVDVKNRVAELKSYFDDMDRCVTFYPPPECSGYEKPSLDDTVDLIFNDQIQPVASTVTGEDGKYKLNLPNETCYLFAHPATPNGVAWVIKIEPGTPKMILNGRNHIPTVLGLRASLLR